MGISNGLRRLTQKGKDGIKKDRCIQGKTPISFSLSFWGGGVSSYSPESLVSSSYKTNTDLGVESTSLWLNDTRRRVARMAHRAEYTFVE